MYLHLGYAQVAPYGEIVGVFDLDNVTAQPRSREFLEKAEEGGTLTPLGDRIPVSLVVTAKRSYLSPISAQTLCKRLAEDQVL